jgi:hypothetical protein
MASDQFRGPEKVRFPALLALAVIAFVIVAIVAATQDPEWAIPVLILLGVVIAAVLGMRLLSGSNRAEGDHTDRIPKQPTNPSRPLGDTTEAHDELSPHDVPKDSPIRPSVEAESGGPGGTTSGPVKPGEPEHGARTEDQR